jgi:phosphomannomutase
VTSALAPPPVQLPTLVQTWIAQDPDPASRQELQQLLIADDQEELTRRFQSTLHFGTAGLRGPVVAGPSGMNIATVRRASAGLARYLGDTVPGSRESGVVIGFDARHGSRRFAEETARVLTGAGFRVLRLPGQLPTPLLAYAVRRLECAAGVMITASHNPAQDNGYKVYVSNGAQIVPPADSAIAAAMVAAGPLDCVPLSGAGEDVDDGIVRYYLQDIIAALPPFAARDLTTVYTPMHGVGRRLLLPAFAQAGFPAPRVVALQGDPDPDFPTVPKPNPEEVGALDLAIADARGASADLVLANDPDADRLSVAIPVDDAAGEWRILTGDEVGALLGDYLLSRSPHPEQAIVATSIVSSGLLPRLAAAVGANCVQTLTGFKWIMHDSAIRVDAHFIFGYEEAIGYAVNDVVRDKDGISAALLVAGIAAEAKAQGTTLAARLEDIARRFGLHATDHFAVELPGAAGSARMHQVMAKLRSAPPTELAGGAVTEIDDVAVGTRRRPDGSVGRLALPPSDVLVFRCGASARLVIRPSGTEPKLKIYLEVVVPIPRSGDLKAATAIAEERLAALRASIRPFLPPT